jgi:hypothetical protein
MNRRGREEPERKIGKTSRKIPNLPLIFPPHGCHSNTPTWHTSLHQKDVHDGTKKGERDKEGRRGKKPNPLGIAQPQTKVLLSISVQETLVILFSLYVFSYV